jgi:DivIVA domain-containing protein
MNSEDIYRIEFSRPRAGRRGYQIDEVDEFLDVIAARLKLRNHLTAGEVHKIAFRRAPVDQGYDTEEVDHFLNRVEAVLGGNHRKPSQPLHGSTPSAPDQRRGRRNRAAVVSLCAAMLGFSLVGLVVAIVSGIVALIQIRRSHQRGRALVVAGLVISAAWVALIFIWFHWFHLGHPDPLHLSTNPFVERSWHR